MREEVWSERKVGTSLHLTVSHPLEVCECSIQAWLITVVVRSSRYLPHIAANEVFGGTHGCCIT
jgi:hypothetical protein